MIKLKPVMTEKSMKLSKDRGFTFIVPMNLTKFEIKKLFERIYKVTVLEVKTVVSKPGKKKNMRGKVQRIKAVKKAIVFLKEGDKIDLFEEEKKSKKTKKGKNAKA